MLLELIQMTEVVTSSADHINRPSLERSVYESECNGAQFRLTEEKGTLVVTVNKAAKDLSGTAFSNSYFAGSYLGRFAVACHKTNGEFSYSFFGVEVPQQGAILPVAGGVTLDKDLKIVKDSAIIQQNVNLYNFNRNRADSIGLK